METHRKTFGRQTDETAQHTRQRIIQSARTLFATRGFQGVSLRDIASHSHVTHGLLRHHFGSKEDIWRAVIDHTLQEFLATAMSSINAGALNTDTALTAVREVSRTTIILAAQYPEITRLLMHESVEGGPRLSYFLEQSAPIRALIDPLILEVQQLGWLNKFSHETFLLTLLMMGAMPFALEAFSKELCKVNIFDEDEIARHADRVLAVLFTKE